MIVGIIGGGQLGMMMAEAAKKLGHKVVGLDPDPTCSLSYIADKMYISEYDSAEKFKTFANECDVLTYEFENVDMNLIKRYESKIPQKGLALQFSKNRFVEKEFANRLARESMEKAEEI